MDGISRITDLTDFTDRPACRSCRPSLGPSSWGRRHCPEVLGGVYDRDEFDTSQEPAPPASPNLMERLPGRMGKEGFKADAVTNGLAEPPRKATRKRKAKGEEDTGRPMIPLQARSCRGRRSHLTTWLHRTLVQPPEPQSRTTPAMCGAASQPEWSASRRRQASTSSMRSGGFLKSAMSLWPSVAGSNLKCGTGYRCRSRTGTNLGLSSITSPSRLHAEQPTPMI
jgi:hypothetical protein